MRDTSGTLSAANYRFNNNMNGCFLEEDAEDEKLEDCCDVEAWEILSKSFKEVQSVLDRNRRLIQQVNDNHQSMIPRNLAKNVELIREINANISTVTGLYANLSSNFSSIVQYKAGKRQIDTSKN
ncbi:hypothetical protein RD792_010262 [Penstemon davidsonii]|uniref:Protein EARLY FLOWERING 4 domain-containing protein n=1 Tax=Penstemon davidsonii TaxID=160366 RepID=A0ABR0D241_9LAMI|nr:hypothetical protein RD792_010262 [Penstemon davidsonii]